MNRLFNIKHLPAKALYLVVFISFVVSVILLLFISNSYFSQIEVLKYQHLKKLVDSNNGAINLSLVNQSNEKNAEFQELQSSIYENVKTSIKQEQWGGFSIVSAKSEWKELNYTKSVLTGNYLFQEEQQGLYLADKGKYLSIAGETRLSGNTYLPALGIRSVYIDGVPYSGSSLIYGAEKTSKKELPKVSAELLSWISNAYNGNYNGQDSLGNLSSLFSEEKIQQSFKKDILVFESNKEIRLANISLSGKIIIKSDSAIYISKTLEASNIIAIAPIIIVEPEFQGSLQILASDSLLIDKNADLQYPSFAAIYNPERTKVFGYLEKGSRIEGGLLCIAGMGDGVDAELNLKEGTTVHGVVYCSGSISHQGEVYGAMYLNRFVLKTLRGYYENHLLNAVVEPQKQMEEMITPQIFLNAYEKGIIDFLN